MRLHDMNLLRIFEAVYRLRNLRLVACEVNLTQPAVSHALARLRAAASDQLFVRTPTGLVPTPRSEMMAPVVREALKLIDDCWGEPVQFEPASSQREIRLLLSDVGESRFMPKLMAHLETAAPHLCVTTVQAPRTEYVRLLTEREADLAIGHLPNFDRNMRQQPLYIDDWVLIGGSRYAKQGRKISLRQFEAARHIVVTPSGALTTQVESMLMRLNIKRRVAVRLTHYLSVMELVQATDMLALMPRSLAKGMRRPDVVIYDLPLPGPQLDIRMCWHPRQDSDPAHAWMRACFIELFSTQR